MNNTANPSRTIFLFVASVGLLAVTLLPTDAMAQDAVTKALNKGVDLLTNRWARAAAIIARRASLPGTAVRA